MNTNLNFNKIMLVTVKNHRKRVGGRELLSSIHADIMRELYNNDLIVYELVPNNVTTITGSAFKIFGYIDGLTKTSLDDIDKLIIANNISTIFIDGSNLGLIAKKVKKKYPKIKVIVFYHNVEARFFWGALKSYKTIKSIFVMVANYYAEKNSVKYSDVRIMLNLRDSKMLEKIYGKSATHISPMVVKDVRQNLFSVNKFNTDSQKYLLFVGGQFYANQAGIEWYSKNVAPYLDIKTVIIGRGFENIRERLEKYHNIEVVGSVESVSQWYENSEFVVAPIFDGSGMKTKVAEALMFGKKIIGTPEAFCGYEDCLPAAGVICVSAEEFIFAANKLCHDTATNNTDELVKIYENNYSLNAAKNRLKNII